MSYRDRILVLWLTPRWAALVIDYHLQLPDRFLIISTPITPSKLYTTRSVFIRWLSALIGTTRFQLHTSTLTGRLQSGQL